MSRTAFLTDKYELTMLSSFFEDGSAANRAVFEVFTRRLPAGRRFGLMAGLGRLIPLIEDFTFDAEEIEWLLNTGAITARVAERLATFRFAGDVWAFPEGEVYWPGSPVLRVEGSLAECVVLETLILSVLNHDSAVAAAAGRMVIAAEGRPIIEMGSRRVHEEAAVAGARAAYLAGFAATSNLAAGKQYGVPVVGTAAHAFTLAHKTEAGAFEGQMKSLGVNTTLLVDTYDTEQGIRTAVDVARGLGATGPGAVRIDSGDLAVEARMARDLLDSLGATETKVTVTSDLDEYLMTALRTSPIDGYGAGTRVATGSGHPTAGMVYKLVAVADTPDGALRPVAKKSSSKVSVGGRKTVYRDRDGNERFSLHGIVPDGATEVQRLVISKGRATEAGRESLEVARERAARTIAGLPAVAREVEDGTAYQTCEKE